MVWTNFAENNVHGVLDPSSPAAALIVNRIGPFDEAIGDNGGASRQIEYGGNLANWTFFYFIDGNDNGVCNPDDDADVKGMHALELDLVKISIAYLAGIEPPAGVCPHFDPEEPTATPSSPSATSVSLIPTASSTPTGTGTPTQTPGPITFMWEIVDGRTIIDLTDKYREKYEKETSLPGLYFRLKDRSDFVEAFGDYFELLSDGTYELSESGQLITGQWRGVGNEIVLTPRR